MSHADATTDQDAPIETSPETGTADAARTLRDVAPWIVAVIAVAVAIVLAVSAFADGGDAAARDDIGAVAGRAVATLTTWSADDLAAVEASVADFGTGRFQDEAREIFAEFAAGLAEADVQSQGEVMELAVSDIVEDRAVALATVRQRIANTASAAEPVTSCWGARITLTRVNGDWLVDRLALFGPNACDEQAGIDGGAAS